MQGVLCVPVFDSLCDSATVVSVPDSNRDNADELCAHLRTKLGSGHDPLLANEVFASFDHNSRKPWKKSAPDNSRFEREDLAYAGIKHISTTPEVVEWIRNRRG